MIFLLVDDDPDDVILFRDTLMEVNKTVELTSAPDGKAALNLLRNGASPKPELIFLDLNMPLMNGKECLQHLKQDATLKDIPVIMYTTSSQSSDIEETMMAGAAAFITKPASVKELKNILASISGGVKHLQKTLSILSNTASTFIVCS
jgi:CheY-like chemotaxis protein